MLVSPVCRQALSMCLSHVKTAFYAFESRIESLHCAVLARITLSITDFLHLTFAVINQTVI